MYYRYELYVDGVPSGYGALVGASIFAVVPTELEKSYNALIEQLPDPDFQEFEGFHCVSYFKDNPTANKLAESIAEIIEKGCKSYDLPVTLEIRKKAYNDVQGVVYEDGFQVVVLEKGSTTFKELFFEQERPIRDVRIEVITEILAIAKGWIEDV